METRDNAPRVCRVVAAYRSPYSDPLVLTKGERLAIGEKESPWPGWVWCMDGEGKSGWVPEAYVRRRGGACTMRRDYDATELSVEVGEELIAGEEESGWVWCTNREGQCGWVPRENVEVP